MKFEDLFLEARVLHPTPRKWLNLPPGWFLLKGAPGTRDGDGYMAVRPTDECLALVPYNAIGAFEMQHSDLWRASDLLPLYVSDPFGRHPTQIALLPFAEYNRWNRYAVA